MINNLTYGMPLAALFIGGVLPALLGSLIRKRAGYMIQPLVVGEKILKARSLKLQASSLTAEMG
jgi:hypothetical protein